MKKLSEMEEVFVSRDEMSVTEAKNRSKELKSEFYDIIENGGSYDDIEDLLLSEGLEMDYLFDLL